MYFWSWLNLLNKECDHLAVIVLWRALDTKNHDIHDSPGYQSADIVSWSQVYLDQLVL